MQKGVVVDLLDEEIRLVGAREYCRGNIEAERLRRRARWRGPTLILISTSSDALNKTDTPLLIIAEHILQHRWRVLP